MRKKYFKVVLISCLVIVLAFGFGFGLVPSYNAFSHWTGLNGKVDLTAEKLIDTSVDRSRLITVRFVATNNAKLPWEFRPEAKLVKIHPGENANLTYFAKNNSNYKMTIKAIPNIAPRSAAKYIRKIACFCFNKQTLKPGESAHMPMVFRFLKSTPSNIHTVTMSYAIFDITKQQERHA
jgi:cytochrome c oxidase assembly protein subunit 11